MSKPMTFKEFAEVVKYIQDHRSFVDGNWKYPRVKYIDPVFDMRTNTVFSVTF